ncbi:MAG: ABC transporter ATP-binding protein [Bacteroidia bacterium]|nr:ABC transporter ATP-binding protein [Bacteroidia bacterium]
MKLEIKNISKTYSNGHKALDNVSLVLENGMFGLLGPNGAGKSTLMRIITTLLRPDQGIIVLDGVDVTHNPEKIKNILGYLPQDFGVYPKMKALDLMMHVAVLKGIEKGKKEMAEHLLNMVNLYEHRHRYVYDFSGGMRQRFGIAQALMGDPKILIVDEPTAGLDPTERNRFQNILSEVSENKIVLFSTHIVQDITELCQKMAVLFQGTVRFEGSPADALDIVKNKIYEKAITKAELEGIMQHHTMLSYKLKYGRMFVSIYSEQHPQNGFEPKAPDLEDVFFYLCKK